ncbi:MAG: pyruvate formate lyase family protein, partial [Omnitrophica WOR_2 bacterium]
DRPEWQAERKQAQAFLNEHYPHYYTPGQTGHCEMDLDRLFRLGIDGLMRDIHKRLEKACRKQAEVYQSFQLALEGLSILIEHAAERAEAALTSASPERRVELTEMAAVCRKIAHQAPSSFHESLQLLWLALLGVQTSDRVGLVNPGRLDRTLWPFYQADIEVGRLTRDRALLLLESLYLLLNETIPDGLAISVMVGGRDARGQDATNELSALCLEALRRTNLIYPTVGVCWHSGTPMSLVDLALELIVKGYKQPAFFNDETIQKGLQQYGVPAEEAYSYINSTCVEITPRGSSNVWVASPYFSTCRFLVDELQAQSGSAQPALSFEEFLASYQDRLRSEIDKAAQANNAERRLRQRYGGKPLQSLFTNDCLELGKDIDDGGARYNWVECSFVGLANLVDALHVIHEEVFHTRKITLQELHSILQANYAGYEKERLRFLNGYAKYGNDSPAVDSLMQTMLDFIRRECARHPMEPDGSPFVPGAFAWIMHEQLGRECGATPDGRKACFPFADGCGAAQGREMKGPTASILSVTSWDAAPLIGGAAFNLKFNRSLFNSPESVQSLRDLILTFLKRGGFETQLNILDSQALKDARANPEKYRDLIVRIGGYSDYFTRLSPGMQEEIILRTEYNQF